MAYVSRDDEGNTLKTFNGDDMLFATRQPRYYARYTVHNWAGIQVTGCETFHDAMNEAFDLSSDNHREGYPTQSYVVIDQKTIAFDCR